MKLTTSSFDHCIEQDERIQLRHTLKLAPPTGEVLEFGVFRGKSIRTIAKVVPKRKVYGFDSFIGLPEDWERGKGDTYKKGHFNLTVLDKMGY